VDHLPRERVVDDHRVAERARKAPVRPERHHVPRVLAGVPIDDEPHDREHEKDERAGFERRPERLGGREVRFLIPAAPLAEEGVPRAEDRLADEIGEQGRIVDRRAEGRRWPGGRAARRVEEHEDREELHDPEREVEPPGTEPAAGPPCLVEDCVPEAALAGSIGEQPVVPEEESRAGPRDGVDEGVLLGRERERERGDAEVEECGPAVVVRPDEEAERDEHEPREQQVVPIEAGVIEQDRVRGEEGGERDRLAVPEPAAKEQRRERQEPANDGDHEAHREVRGSEEGEHVAVDDRQERAVDDRAIPVDARLHVAVRPERDASLVLVGDARAEPEQPDGERGEGDDRDNEARASDDARKAVADGGGRDRRAGGLGGHGLCEAGVDRAVR